MKLQDVLLKAMAKRISWADAAEIIGISCRSMRRWRERLERHGYAGLADRRKGKASPRRVPLATMEEVFRLYRERYFDLSGCTERASSAPNCWLELAPISQKTTQKGLFLAPGTPKCAVFVRVRQGCHNGRKRHKSLETSNLG